MPMSPGDLIRAPGQRHPGVGAASHGELRRCECDQGSARPFLNLKGHTMQTISESGVRRLARREGYLVRKSRSRDPDAIGYGAFMLIDRDTGGAILGGYPFQYTADLEEIREYLTQ